MKYIVEEGIVSTMKIMMIIKNILKILAFSLFLFSIAWLLACSTVFLFKARHASQYTTPMIKVGMIEINKYHIAVEAKCTFGVIIALNRGWHVSSYMSICGKQIAKEINQINTTKGVVHHSDRRGESGFAMILKYK